MEPKILIPVDDSSTAEQTVASIIKEKERFTKKLTLVHIVNHDIQAYIFFQDHQREMVKKNAEKAGRHLLEELATKLEAVGFEVTQLLEIGEPRHLIADIANQQKYQLLVLGRHEGGGELRDVLFGSVANFVLHNVKCPVLLF